MEAKGLRGRARAGPASNRLLAIDYGPIINVFASPAREISLMINVTPAAASKISELLTEENKVSAGLRVFVQGGGCSGFQYGLMIDEGEGDATTDAVIESNGVKLLVDPISARYLRGAEVDFIDNITGGGFTIKNPNAKSTCGCGSSFSV
jgi:iron-sulfur cluster insertion protein